jgi:hypothetical protein
MCEIYRIEPGTGTIVPSVLDAFLFAGFMCGDTIRAMTLHLVKLCVGCDSIDELAEWQADRLRQMRAEGQKKPELFHRTFQMPKRRDDLLNGGSLYWVIKGIIQARQRLIDLRTGTKADGTPCSLLILDRQLVMVRPVPRRPFQGWRYLAADEAPADLGANKRDQIAEMPQKLRRDLAELGLL